MTKSVSDKIMSLERMGYTVINDGERQVVQVRFNTNHSFRINSNTSYEDFITNDHIVEIIVRFINDVIMIDL